MMKNNNTKPFGWWLALVRLFYPKHCVVCGAVLQDGEEAICLKCNMDMPRTGFHLEEGNPVERMFWGKLPVRRASSYLYYRKGSGYARILRVLKYGGRRDVGIVFGRFMGEDLQASGFFQGIDVIVPVPLHPRKRKARGYNQSECIARGLSAVTGIPVDAASVKRLKHTDTQTHKSAYERWENVAGIFELEHPEKFAHMHILLVDDVLTTGATLTACADAFAGTEGVSISILTLALAD